MPRYRGAGARIRAATVSERLPGTCTDDRHVPRNQNGRRSCGSVAWAGSAHDRAYRSLTVAALIRLGRRSCGSVAGAGTAHDRAYRSLTVAALIRRFTFQFLSKLAVNPGTPLRVLYLRGTITLALRMGVVGLKRIDRCLRDQYLSQDFTRAVAAVEDARARPRKPRMGRPAS